MIFLKIFKNISILIIPYFIGCYFVQGMENLDEDSASRVSVPPKPFIKELREKISNVHLSPVSDQDYGLAELCNFLKEKESQLRRQMVLRGKFDDDLFRREEEVLYHGSGNKNIGIFEPKSEHIRDPNEGPVVFATPSSRLASCYLVRWDDSWVHQSIHNSHEIRMVISDRERFEAHDLGGTIYCLPSGSFGFDEKKGLGVYEWTSKESVVPVARINFPSALAAMKQFGIRVYFLNKSDFEAYTSLSSENQNSFLTTFKQA